jgi:hypothetical protein
MIDIYYKCQNFSKSYLSKEVLIKDTYLVRKSPTFLTI